jgi:hypothetical protein
MSSEIGVLSLKSLKLSRFAYVMPQVGLDEIIQPAIQHCFSIAYFMISAVIFHHFIRVKDI